MRGLRQRLGRCRSRRWGKAHRRRNLRCPRPRWPLRILRRERRRRALKTALAGRRIIVGEIRPCRLVAEISGPVLVLLLLQNFPCTVAMDYPGFGVGADTFLWVQSSSSGIVAAAEIREHGDQRHHQQDTRHPSPPPAAAQLLHGRRRNSPRTDTGTGVRAPIVERPHAFSSSCKDSERSRKGSDDWVAWQSWRWRRKQWW